MKKTVPPVYSRIVPFSFFILAAFLIYGRTVNYEFVYDDLWRIKNNSALSGLSNPVRFFLNPETQSSLTHLNTHTYRPLLSFGFALEHLFWGDNPAGYRALNIVFHAVNSALGALCGEVFLGLSPWAGLLAGLFFLVHPLQAESVVWVVERSNLIGAMSVLLGLLLWYKYRTGKNLIYLASTYIILTIGLFYRENSACLPIAILLTDLFSGNKLHPPNAITRANSLQFWKKYLGLFFIVGLFLSWRMKVLGTLSQIGYWGGTFGTNILSIVKTWPHYLAAVLFPGRLSANYSMPIAHGLIDRGVLWGIFLFAAFAASVLGTFRKSRKISFCLALFLLFWLPTSGLIPLETLYADRFAYLLLVPAGWALGLAFEKLDRTRLNSKALSGIISTVLFLYLGVLTLKTLRTLPAWRNELSLWENAVSVDPRDSFSWFCLGLEQERISGALPAEDGKKWADSALASYKNALGEKVKPDFAGEVFLKMAKIFLEEGNKPMAEEHASRALILRPDLKEEWDLIRQELQDKSGH